MDNFKLLAEEIHKTLVTSYYKEILDPVAILFKKAASESADFIERHLHTALVFRDKEPKIKFRNFVINKANNNGYFIELGVSKGESLLYFAKEKPACTFYGFDSFEGLPEDWYGACDPKGTYGNDSYEVLCEHSENIKIIQGLFEETVPKFVEQMRNKSSLNGENSEKKQPYISFMHLDANIYSATKFALDNFMDFFDEGTVLVFDDFLAYPGYKNNEFKAFHETIDVRFNYKFIAFQHMRAAIIILGKK